MTIAPAARAVKDRRESMSPRERWLAVLQGTLPDRVPMDYWGTDEATEKLMRHLGCGSPWECIERLHIDRVVGVRPAYAGPTLPDGEDIYGRRYVRVDYGSGAYDECCNAPLAGFDHIDEIERSYRWPTADWFDYSGLARQIQGKEAYPVQGGGSEPFLIYCDLRGREQAMMDLLLNPELVHYCLDRLFDFAYENTRRIYEALPDRVDLSYVAEDFGGQQNLLFAPATIREFFLPRMQRMMELAHQAGAYVFFHSDGAIRTIIPDMIEAGIDILNPIQWRSPGMARAELKASFGDRVVFHGAMDNQQTLPFGTVDDVVQEVVDNLTILGRGGGYIIAPCHNVQAVSPPENIVTLYKTAYAEGWY